MLKKILPVPKVAKNVKDRSGKINYLELSDLPWYRSGYEIDDSDPQHMYVRIHAIIESKTS